MAVSDYVFIKNNTVVNVVVFDNPSQELLNIFKEHHGVDEILPCNNNPKAVMNATYSNGQFILPRPYESWILDENFDWIPPIPAPVVEGKSYYWSEDDLTWLEVSA